MGVVSDWNQHSGEIIHGVGMELPAAFWLKWQILVFLQACESGLVRSQRPVDLWGVMGHSSGGQGCSEGWTWTWSWICCRTGSLKLSFAATGSACADCSVDFVKASHRTLRCGWIQAGFFSSCSSPQPFLFKLSFTELRLNQTKSLRLQLEQPPPLWKEKNNSDKFRIQEMPSLEAQAQLCFILFCMIKPN